MVALLISVICENAKREEKKEFSKDRNLDFDTALFDTCSSNTDKLVQKYANDALKSLKTQETINKLASIGSSRSDLEKVSQQPIQEHEVWKSKLQSARSKAISHDDRKKRKRKRHKHRHRRKRLKNRRPRWSKKAPAKVDYGPDKKQNLGKMKIHTREPKGNPKKQKSKMIRKNIPKDDKFMIDNMTLINWDNLNVEDYIDLTQSTNSKIDTSTKPVKTRTMVEGSSSTVTKSSKKKNPDYYKDDEFDEVGKLKEKRKNPRARSIRQSFVVSPSNRNSNDDLYIPNRNVENNPDFKYLDENANSFENHLSNSMPYASVETNDANANPLNLQIDKEQSILSNELEPQKSYNSMILPTGQDQNLRPAKTNENFITGVSNFEISKLDHNDRSRPLSVGQENSVNTDINPAILQSNEHQYTVPLENDNINLYNNYVLNSGQEDKVPNTIEDNLNYLQNYDTYLQKPDEKYVYPIVHNLPENKIELTNPNQYEKTFAQPEDQELLRYVPVYKNTYQGDRLLLVNSSDIRNDKTSTNLRGNINTNKPLRKISDTSSSREYVQPVERFPNPRNFESGERKWRKEDEANNLMKQQITRRGLLREFLNSRNVGKFDESAAEREETLRKEFAKRRKNAIRNRNSVEEDVANLQRIDIAATVNETKEVADQILNRIVDELEEIKMDHSKDKNSEGFPCKLTGSWVTSKAGVRIDINVVNHSIIITLANLIPQPMHVGFLNTTWNVTGHAPFKRGGPFSLFAHDNHTKTLAAFVGSCRVCQGIDTIVGIWSIAREPRDCRNFQMATEVVNDIFRRTKLLSAIKEKKKAILQTMLVKNINNVTSYNEKNKSDDND